MHILLMYSTHVPSQNHIDRIVAMHPSIEVSVAESESDAIKKAQKANIIFGHRYLRQCLPMADQLLWVQSTAGGVDRLPCPELAQKSVMLTNMTIAASTIARHAVTMAWSINRSIPNFYRQQMQGVWSQTHEWLPYPIKSMILGMGSVGLSIAKLLDNDDIEVIGVKQTPVTSIPPHFSKVCYGDSWLDELPSIDWIFLALPKTNQTVNLIDREVLCRLPSHAILVNVGRGETLVTKDLCEYLNEGKLGGAALDVISPKPIEANDIFWSTSRLIITPHIASHCKERSTNIEVFCELQLSKFINKLSIDNIVKWDF